MWDERYDRDEYVYGTEPNRFLAEQAWRLAPHSRVLNLCEGEGRNAVFLAMQGHDVTGVDGSAVGLEKAQKLAAAEGVTIQTRVADLADYDPGESEWDAIVSVFAHLPPALRATVHRRVVKALRPGGLLLLEAYTPDQIGRGTGGPPSEEMMMNLARLEAELPGMTFLLAEERLRTVREGIGHSGDGAVVQLVARKPE